MPFIVIFIQFFLFSFSHAKASIDLHHDQVTLKGQSFLISKLNLSFERQRQIQATRKINSLNGDEFGVTIISPREIHLIDCPQIFVHSSFVYLTFPSVHYLFQNNYIPPPIV